MIVLRKLTALLLALLMQSPAMLVHLARRGIYAARDVSLISAENEPCLEWCQPAVSHFTWDPQPVVQWVVWWVKNVAADKKDKRQVLFGGAFVEGGTIGPVA